MIKSITIPWDFMSCHMTWHELDMKWHDIHDEICCNINITAELLCQKCLHGPVWLTLGGAFCSFWWSWRITSFAHCFQRISEGWTASSHVGFCLDCWNFPWFFFDVPDLAWQKLSLAWVIRIFCIPTSHDFWIFWRRCSKCVQTNCKTLRRKMRRRVMNLESPLKY